VWVRGVGWGELGRLIFNRMSDSGLSFLEVDDLDTLQNAMTDGRRVV
jgi:hypothetical protein